MHENEPEMERLYCSFRWASKALEVLLTSGEVETSMLFQQSIVFSSHFSGMGGSEWAARMFA